MIGATSSAFWLYCTSALVFHAVREKMTEALVAAAEFRWKTHKLVKEPDNPHDAALHPTMNIEELRSGI